MAKWEGRIKNYDSIDEPSVNVNTDYPASAMAMFNADPFAEKDGYPTAPVKEDAVSRLDRLQAEFELAKRDNIPGHAHAVFNEAFALARSMKLPSFWGGKYGTQIGTPQQPHTQGSVTSLTKEQHDRATGQDTAPTPNISMVREKNDAKVATTPNYFNRDPGSIRQAPDKDWGDWFYDNIVSREKLQKMDIPSQLAMLAAEAAGISAGVIGTSVGEALGFPNLLSFLQRPSSIAKNTVRGVKNTASRLGSSAIGDYEAMAMNRGTREAANLQQFNALQRGETFNRDLLDMNTYIGRDPAKNYGLFVHPGD